MDALVTIEPLGLSVKTHVLAVMLSPLSASPLPESPSIICPATAIIAPVNSARFWYRPRTLRSSNLRHRHPKLPLCLPRVRTR